MILRERILEAARLVPEVKSYLPYEIRYKLYTPEPYKSLAYFVQQIKRIVTSLYNGNIGGEFIDLMANLISGQLRDAYEKAWDGDGDLPDYLISAWEADVLAQYDHVDKYYRDIVDARVDKTPIDPLLSRAELWGNRWNESYNNAQALIAENEGGNLVWELGATEKHCPLCKRFNGIVARAKDWITLRIAPQNAPNLALTGEIGGEKGCEGWHCDCRLTPTDKRRSPNAYGRLEEILLSK